MKRVAAAVLSGLVLTLVLAALGAPSASAAGRTGRVRWGTSACVYAASSLAAIRLEGVTVSSRVALRGHWAAQYVRVAVTYQAAAGPRWRTVGTRKRLVKVRTSVTPWKGQLLFTRIGSAVGYRAVVRALWYDPATGRVQGTREQSITCATHQTTPALTCPTGLHWASPTLLAWDPVPGATGYYVRQRRLDGALAEPMTAAGSSAGFGTAYGVDPDVVTWVEPFNRTGTINCGSANVVGRTDRMAADGDNAGGPSTLLPGGWLFSPSGQYYLVMQGDGHLVLYQNGVGPLWWTPSVAGAYAVIQSDGNFVQYPAISATQGPWNSGTNGIGSGATVRVMDTGDVVVFDHTGNWRWKVNGRECSAGCRN